MHMNPNRTELVAAWIVALALIAAMGAHALLPSTPPRLEPGVTDAGQPRAVREAPSRAFDLDVPPIDLGDPVLSLDDRRSLAGPGRGSENAPGRGKLPVNTAGA
jgi:hypothetical protein